jgi:hypothetical protein
MKNAAAFGAARVFKMRRMTAVGLLMGRTFRSEGGCGRMVIGYVRAINRTDSVTLIVMGGFAGSFDGFVRYIHCGGLSVP